MIILDSATNFTEEYNFIVLFMKNKFYILIFFLLQGVNPLGEEKYSPWTSVEKIKIVLNDEKQLKNFVLVFRLYTEKKIF